MTNSLNKKNIYDKILLVIKNGKAVTAIRGIQTENINSCTAGVLKAGNKHFMFHAAPEMQTLGSIKQELEKQVMNLRRICDEVHGFICGGWQLDNRDKSTVQSFDLYNKIAESFANDLSCQAFVEVFE